MPDVSMHFYLSNYFSEPMERFQQPGSFNAFFWLFGRLEAISAATKGGTS